MKGHNKNTEIIIAYLEEQRKKDDQLDEAMNKAEENGKTSDAMWGYIFNKAKENLSGQSGAVESETVFSWAIHYMIETNEELAKELPAVKPIERQEVKEQPKPEPKKKESKPKQDPGFIQISLFDE